MNYSFQIFVGFLNEFIFQIGSFPLTFCLAFEPIGLKCLARPNGLPDERLHMGINNQLWKCVSFQSFIFWGGGGGKILTETLWFFSSSKIAIISQCYTYSFTPTAQIIKDWIKHIF